MKKILSFLLIPLFLFAACGKEAPTADLGPGFSHYGNGYTMQFPNQKWGQVNIMPENDTLDPDIRYERVSIPDDSGKYHEIFVIVRVPVAKWETWKSEPPNTDSPELGRNKDYVFTYAMAQDIPKNMNDRAKEVEGIIKTLKAQ